MTDIKPELTKLIDYLNSKIKEMTENNDDMNASSWGYEEGIVLSGNDVKLLINAIDEAGREERERTKRIASQLKFSKEDDSYDAGWNNALDTVINDVDGCSEDYKSKELGGLNLE